jgi:hypothetical protein
MEKLFPHLTAEVACDSLRKDGVTCAPQSVEIVEREQRWAVLLPGDRIAWFARSEAGSERLAIERRVLRLLAERCCFSAPRLLSVSDASFDLRQMVRGRFEPWMLYQRCRTDPALARSIGHSIGAILTEQHTKIGRADVAGWLPQQVAWPEPSVWIRERLPTVVDDAALMRTIERVIERYDAVPVDAEDLVLIHGDVGLHNIGLDPQTDAVTGIFDYDSAAWADRHHDLRYLVFDIEREDMLDAALEVYEPAVERHIDRNRVRLYNAICAISFLAFRSGTPPEQKSCGRTLAEDLRWVAAAAAKIGL